MPRLQQQTCRAPHHTCDAMRAALRCAAPRAALPGVRAAMAPCAVLACGAHCLLAAPGAHAAADRPFMYTYLHACMICGHAMPCHGPRWVQDPNGATARHACRAHAGDRYVVARRARTLPGICEGGGHMPWHGMAIMPCSMPTPHKSLTHSLSVKGEIAQSQLAAHSQAMGRHAPSPATQACLPVCV